MTTRDPKRRALERLIGEARNEATPELRWDALEARLVKRLGEARKELARPRSTGVPWTLALAGAAALGAGFILLGRFQAHSIKEPVSVQQAPGPEADRHHLDGDTLTAGAVVKSDDEPVVVEHVGRATWTLAPESALHVESVGGVIALALDSGSVSAHVVKSPKPESFVVRVERTRVAVHGTRFRVDRVGSTVQVEVEEGVVGVGPVGGKAFELAAPGAAMLSLDGVRTDGPVAKARPTQRVAEEPSKEAPKAEAPAAGPSDEERVTAGVDGVVEGIRACFTENTFSRGDLKVSVQTKMSLHVLANGHVEEAGFAPPLAPAVTRCVDGKLGSVEFPESQEDFVVERLLSLDR